MGTVRALANIGYIGNVAIYTNCNVHISRIRRVRTAAVTTTEDGVRPTAAAAMTAKTAAAMATATQVLPGLTWVKGLNRKMVHGPISTPLYEQKCTPLREGDTGCPRKAPDGGTKVPERTDGAHKRAYDEGPRGAQGNLGGSSKGLARGSKTKRHSPLSDSDRGRFPLRI